MKALRLTAAPLTAAILLLWISSASAAFGISNFDGSVDANETGDAYTQAGGHPYAASTTFELNEIPDSTGNITTDGGLLKTVRVDLPPGLIGNPTALNKCPIALFLLGSSDNKTGLPCPESTQVGTTKVKFAIGSATGTIPSVGVPVYGLPSASGAAATFGFIAAGLPIFLDAHVSAEGGYHVLVEVRDTSQATVVLGSAVTLWGLPSEPSHDAFRGCQGANFALGCPTERTDIPFLTLPTACTPPGQGLTTRLRADSWSNPGVFTEASFESHLPPGGSLSTSFPPHTSLPPNQWGPPQGPTGCNQVPFTPEASLQPTSHEADSATGLNVDISVPTDGLLSQSGIAQSNLKQAVVTLPEGMSVNPASASGLGSCAPDQIRLGTDLGLEPGDPNCPDASKVGTVTIDTPLLEDQLEGAVYLANPHENPFDSLLALYIVVKSPERGIIVKLAGEVSPDPVTGRLQTTFDENPQVPFSNLHLELKSGSRAPLITPRSCGTHTTIAELTPWARPGEPVEVKSSFQITSGPGGRPCPGADQFDPAFEAGTLTPIAGSYSPLIVNASRPDGSAPLTGLQVKLPPGLSGKLAGVVSCPESALTAATTRTGAAEAASPSCPSTSRLGSVDVAAGAGPNPFHVSGTAYLAGPYKGAPISAAVITPALAGPFDLGTVVVRAALRIDRASAQITIDSDPIPQILQGIPLQIRSASVLTDRPEFTLNPTDCDPMSVGGTLFSALAAQPVSSPFQVGACKALDYTPKLKIRLKGATKRTAHPKLIATLTQAAGQANTDRAQVTLPTAALLDNAHIGDVCTRVQFNAEACPPGSVYGRASARSPLLDYAVSGPVYLRSSANPLPDLVADLHGPPAQPLRVELVGRTDSTEAGALRNTFDAAPDVPVSDFRLELFGGRRGLLIIGAGLCKHRLATVRLRAHSGARLSAHPRIAADCGGKGKGTARKGRTTNR